MCRTGTPAAANSTIRARRARPAATDGLRVNRINSVRTPSLSSITRGLRGPGIAPTPDHDWE